MPAVDLLLHDAPHEVGREEPIVATHRSPGGGTIAVSSTSSSAGTRSQMRGAVNPANDWATTTSSWRSPMASTAMSA